MGLSRVQQRQKIEGLIMKRIIAMLEDESTSNGDVFKAVAVFCEHFRSQDGQDDKQVEVVFR